MMDFSDWQATPPDRFGLWIVMRVDVPDGELIGFVRVRNGPRGGHRAPHWVDPELGAKVRSSHWDPLWRCKRLHINWLSNAESACRDATALLRELETTKEKLRREIDVRVKAQVECQDARGSERPLLALVRAQPTPPADEAEVGRLRQREIMLSELLWQAWRCFHDGAGDTAEHFLRYACVNEGIMDETGGKLPVAREVGRKEG
jgi:hypothetical protein